MRCEPRVRGPYGAASHESWIIRDAMTACVFGVLLFGAGTFVAAEPATSAPSATSARAVFSEANQAYRAAEYEQAADGYRAVLAQGVESGALYYNLGNALLKAGQRGEALWAYLNAQRLTPRDADLLSNLAYVRSLLGDTAGAADVSVRPPTVVTWLTFGGHLTTAEWAWLWAGLLLPALLLWAIVLWTQRRSPWLARVAIGVSVLTVYAGTALLLQHAQIDAVPRAVIVQNDADVKFAPQQDGTTHYVLPEGAVVQPLQEQSGWVQVRRADGRSGWVAQGFFKAL